MRRVLTVLILLTAATAIIALFIILAQEPPKPRLEEVPEPPAVVPTPVDSIQGAIRNSGTLRGKVVYADGRPAPGASVIALAPYLQANDGPGGEELPLWGEMIERKRFRTGTDGTFVLEDLPPDYWNLWVEKKGYGFTTVPRTDFKKNHTITLYPACSVTGRVEYEDGTPASDVRIEYTPQGTHSEIFSRYRLKSYYTTTRKDGTFTYTGLPPGKFTVEVYPDDHLPAPYSAEPPLQPGENRVLRKRILDRGFGMTVHVRWRGSGEPVDGIEVNARPIGDPMPRTTSGRRGRTDATGTIRFSGLGGQVIKKPRFLVTANIGGEIVMPEEGGSVEPDSTVTILARRKAEIVGTVLGPNGDPLPRFFIEFDADGFITSQLNKWVTNPEKGRFSVEGIPEGTYEMTVRFPGLIDRKVRVTAVAGRTVDAGTIQLREGAEIYGSVRRDSNKEIEGIVRVVVARKGTARGSEAIAWTTVGRAVVQSDGSYRIKGLPPGDFFIQPTSDSNLSTTEPEPIRVASATDVVRKDLVIYGSGFVDLKYWDMIEGARRQVVPVPTFLRRKADGEESVWKGNATRFRPGTYELIVELKGKDGVPKRYTVQTLTVQEDETTGPIEISLFEIRDAQ
ncbi:MAG: carboxypeptidase regulatory-like domain-containing protein [Planctomycetota bacterium]